MTAIIAILGALGLVALLVVYSTLSWAFVIHQYYYWFFLPLVPQAPHIDFHAAIAIAFLLTLFRNHTTTSIKDEYKDKTMEWVMIFLSPWMSLLIAWFFK